MSAASKAMTVPPAPSAPVALNEPTTILQVIERAARDPNIDVEKMERLFAMRERMEDKAAEREFNSAMQSVQSLLPKVLKDRGNDHTKSRYATLEAIIKAINPIVTENGFALSFGTDQSPYPGHYRVTCVLSHFAGHTRSYHADVPADAVGAKGTSNKNPIQAVGSAITYARRYLTTLIFNVATGEDDDDGHAATDRRVSPPSAPSVADASDAKWIENIQVADSKADLLTLGQQMQGLSKEQQDRLRPVFNTKIKSLKAAEQETIHVPESRQGRQPLPKEPVDPTDAGTDAEPMNADRWLDDLTGRMRSARTEKDLDEIWEIDGQEHQADVSPTDFSEARDCYLECKNKFPNA